MKLSPQKQKIHNLYKDGEWHCSSEIQFIRDFRKRISEMNESGYQFDSIACDRRCGIKHNSNIHMYRLIDEPKVKKQVVEQLPNGHVRISYV